MRLLWYNLQDPLDPQINGFGIYRSAVNGVIELLVERKHIGGRSNAFPSVEFAICHPWEAADCTNQELVPVWANPTQFTIGTDTSPTAATSSNTWESSPAIHANNADTYRATQPWEVTFFDINQPHITWAIASTMDDNALGAEVEFDNDPPIGNHLVVSHQEQLFIAGDPGNVVDRLAAQPHLLYYSKRFRPESFPTNQFLEIGTANDPITALTTIAGLLSVFTRDTKYRVTGNASSGFTHYEAISRRGTRATKSVVPSDHGILFVANDGVFATNMIGPDKKLSGKIESLFTGDTISDESPINQAAMDQVAGTFYKDKYYFVAPVGSATVPNRMFVYAFDTEEWTTYDLGGGSMLYEPDTDFLVLGGDDRFCYVMETGVTDNSAAISAEVRTKDFQGGSYNTNNLFLYFKADVEVANGTTLTVKFYVDDVLRHTKTITYTAGRVNGLHSLPEGVFGKRWRVTMTFSDTQGTTTLYGCAAIFIPLASS